MSVSRLAYDEFASRAQRSPGDPFAPSMDKDKTVYVFVLTRDRCSGCETQKPLYKQLADATHRKYGDQVHFSTIHITQDGQFREKLRELCRIVKFVAYPTYLVLLKTEFGASEIYRSIEPPMEEIARNIDVAVNLVKD